MTELYYKILAAVAPAVILAVIIIRKDRQPEPVKWLLAAVVLGMLAGVAALVLGLVGLTDFPINNYGNALLSAFVGAAIPEECLKFAALYMLARRCRYFDEMYDGIVYAVCIGMGFAGLENILYIAGEDQWIVVSVARALMAVPMHYFFAVIMGAFFAMGWFDPGKRMRYMTIALLFPIAVHGLYDTLCFTMDIDEQLSCLILMLFMLGFKYIRRYTRTLINNMQRADGYEF